MKKTKLTALALTALIAFGGITNSAFAATATADTTIASSNHDEGIRISNEDLIKDAKGITKEEKTLFIENYNARDKLLAQIYAIGVDKSHLSASEQIKMEELTKQLDELCQKVSNIELKAFGSTNNYVTDKVDPSISNEDLIKDAKGITKEEKSILLENYNARDKISEQIFAIGIDKSHLSASEQKKTDELTKQLDELCQKVSNIEIKAWGSTNNYVSHPVAK